jgi:hypothetical protein
VVGRRRMNGEDEPLLRELRQLTGESAPAWTSEPLLHNKQNAVTGSIDRIVLPGWSAVLKVVGTGDGNAKEHWLASTTLVITRDLLERGIEILLDTLLSVQLRASHQRRPA